MSNIEEQLKSSLKAILSKPVKKGEMKPVATAAWISDKAGKPVSGLVRKEGEDDIKEMSKKMVEGLGKIPILVWKNIPQALLELRNLETQQPSVNHVTVGFNCPNTGDILSGNMEISIIRYGEYFLNSIYKIPEK